MHLAHQGLDLASLMVYAQQSKPLFVGLISTADKQWGNSKHMKRHRAKHPLRDKTNMAT